jgi:hypothetical protein
LAATYDATLTTAKDRARLLLGDVPDTGISGTIASPLLQDETIEAMLEQFPYNEAVRQLAMSLIARFSAEPDSYEEGNGVKLSWRSRLEGWRSLLKELKAAQPPAAARSAAVVGQLTAPDMAEMRTY